MFLVFEGIDGSGKSTQSRLLEKYLREERGLEVLHVREPGGTPLGEKLREIILHPDAEKFPPETELFLFMAARAQLVQACIRPALARGQVVISDRFLWSSAAYQGVGSGITAREILRVGRVAVAGVTATRTFVIDVEPETALQRATEKNRIEARGLEYQRRVRQEFLSLAKRVGHRAKVIDGEGSVEEVHARVVEALPLRGWGGCARS